MKKEIRVQQRSKVEYKTMSVRVAHGIELKEACEVERNGRQ